MRFFLLQFFVFVFLLSGYSQSEEYLEYKRILSSDTAKVLQVDLDQRLTNAVEFKHQENYQNALTAYFEYISNVQQQDSYLKASVYFDIGTILSKLKLYQLGAEFIEKSQEFKPNGINRTTYYNNLAVVYFQGKDFQKAADLFSNSIQENSNADYIPTITNNIARSYFFLKKYDSCEHLLLRNLKINNRDNALNKREYIQSINLIYELNDATKDFELFKSIQDTLSISTINSSDVMMQNEFYQHCLSLALYQNNADGINLYSKLLKDKGLLSSSNQLEVGLYNQPKLFSLLGQIELENKEEYDELKTSFNNSLNSYSKLIAKNLQLQEEKNELAEAEAAWYRNTTIIISISSIVMLLSILFSIKQYKSNVKRRRAIVIADLDKKQALLREKNLEIKVAQQELEIKAKDVQNLSYMVSESSKLKEEIISDLKTINSIDKTTVNAVIQRIRDVSSKDTERATLTKSAENYSQEFWKVFKGDHPELSEAQVKLCAFLKLGLSNKEIANLKNVEVGTIRTLKYRIKRKLNLPKEQSLEEFIQSIN